MTTTIAQSVLELTLSVENWIIVALVIVAAAAGVVGYLTYKRCPVNRVLVIFGRVGGDRAFRCLHGGGSFVVPLIQGCSYLSLEPIAIEASLDAARTKDNVPVNFSATFTVAVSTDQALMNNAAERLLNLPAPVIRDQAHDIILEQLRLVVAEMAIEEIKLDREKFANLVFNIINSELGKLGLYLINVHVHDVATPT